MSGTSGTSGVSGMSDTSRTSRARPRRTRSGRRPVAALAATLLALGLAACGVSTNDEPQLIERENVPADLLEADVRTDDDSAELNEANGQGIRVWFVVEGEDGTAQVQPADRFVPPPARAAVRIGVLFNTEQNPSVEERERGITTAIPPEARLTALPTQEGSVLEVSLSDDFYGRGGSSFIRAVAQLVFTVTDIPDVDAVRFLDVDGTQIAVLDGDGVSRDDPVGRDDYANLDPDGG